VAGLKLFCVSYRTSLADRYRGSTVGSMRCRPRPCHLGTFGQCLAVAIREPSDIRSTTNDSRLWEQRGKHDGVSVDVGILRPESQEIVDQHGTGLHCTALPI
jgi:hypothetical protein